MRQTKIEKAIQQLEQERAVLDLAIARLTAQVTVVAPVKGPPRRRAKPAEESAGGVVCA